LPKFRHLLRGHLSGHEADFCVVVLYSNHLNAEISAFLLHSPPQLHGKDRTLNLDQILGELRNERDRLDRAIAALDGISTGKAVTRRGRRGGRHLSAAARARIAAAQRARWAKLR